MKIALLGYGKMGRMIESIAVSRGHEITARIDGYTENIDFAGADVSIDFSVPSSAVHHITSSVNAGIPVVSGTTGWTEKMPEVRKLVEEKSGALVYSSNFSLGKYLFRAQPLPGTPYTALSAVRTFHIRNPPYTQTGRSERHSHNTGGRHNRRERQVHRMGTRD